MGGWWLGGGVAVRDGHEGDAQGGCEGVMGGEVGGWLGSGEVGW